MRYLIAGMLTVAAVLLIGGILQWLKSRRMPPECHIHLVIPVGATIHFDPEQAMSAYRRIWNGKIVCAEAGELFPRTDHTRTYIMGDLTNNNVRIVVSDKPLPAELTEITIAGALELDDADRAAIRAHKATISIDYLIGKSSPAERAAFAAQILLTLLQQQDTVGYVDVAGMLYRPRKTVEPMFGRTELDPSTLYQLFTNTHFVNEGESYWIHTHGMEQWELPDLEVRFRDANQKDYMWNIVSNAAVYMINEGPIMKPGHSAELAGDGRIFQITKSHHDSNHPFGSSGALTLNLE